MKKIIEQRREKTKFNFDQYSPLLQRIYSARGITCEQELQYRLEFLPAPEKLKNIDAAVELLNWALRENKHIVVIGDFDADGATSCALAIRGLRSLGFSKLSYLVPNRFQFGYGLTPEIVALAGEHNPDLIITVDNGISSHAGVCAAKQAGIRVLITDHHLPADSLPDADVIINPNQPGDEFPSKSIAGVGVMFYLLVAFRAYLRSANKSNVDSPNLAQWLDLVALGTVADVVPLDHCNRTLIAQGLKRIKSGHTIAGIKALLEQANKSLSGASVKDLGFCVGPQLNAAGRLQDMSLGIECLLTDDMLRAKEIAIRLKALNQERRKIESAMADEAFALIESSLQVEKVLPAGLCLYEPQWHQGVIGIVASRVKEHCHRPVFAFAQANDHELKGSGRSIHGVHLRDVLSAIANKYPGLFTKFGGHAMAAGMSLAIDKFEIFKKVFTEEVQNWIDPCQIQNIVLTDGPLLPGEMSMKMVQQIDQAGPWGQEFPEPVFDGVFEIRNRRILKDVHLKLALRAAGVPFVIDAIAFNYHRGAADSELPQEGDQVRMAYRLEINEYNHRRQLQLRIEAIDKVG